MGSGEEKAALQNLQRLVHVDDPWRLQTAAKLVSGGEGPGNEFEARLTRMLGAVLFGFEDGSDVHRIRALLGGMARLRWELDQLQKSLARRSRVVRRMPSQRLPPEVPLHLHARYLTEEIAAAFDVRTRTGQLYRPQTGVFAAGPFDLLLVTLDKTSKSAVPHLQYEDYAISPRLFHWESQASTRRDDPKGRRHLSDEVQPLLFIREVNKDDRGLAGAYRYLGAVKRVDDEGERPIRITWELLEADLPAQLLEKSRTAIA